MEELQGSSSKQKKATPKIVAAWFDLTTARERLIVLVGIGIVIVGLIARYNHLESARVNYEKRVVTEFEKE